MDTIKVKLKDSSKIYTEGSGEDAIVIVGEQVKTIPQTESVDRAIAEKRLVRADKSDAETEDAGSSVKKVKNMNKSELLEFAEKNGVEVDSAATVAELKSQLASVESSDEE